MSNRENPARLRKRLPSFDRGPFSLPPLYAILDIDCLVHQLGNRGDVQQAASSRDAEAALLSTVIDFAQKLHQGGVRWLQYRAKQLPARSALAHAKALRQTFPKLTLIMNDRADLCLAADFDGVHVGQDDLWPGAVRPLVGNRIVGVSTHSPEQVAEASASPADYVAIGPVFATGSKPNPDPVVGLEGVRRARQLTTKPLVAIGGITLANCREVRAAGADSVAIISALASHPRQSAEGFLRILS